MKKKTTEELKVDGELLKIRNFLREEFSHDINKLHVTIDTVYVSNVSLTDKIAICDFKFKFYKTIHKTIIEFNSIDTDMMKSISFTYA